MDATNLIFVVGCVFFASFTLISWANIVLPIKSLPGWAIYAAMFYSVTVVLSLYAASMIKGGLQFVWIAVAACNAAMLLFWLVYPIWVKRNRPEFYAQSHVKQRPERRSWVPSSLVLGVFWVYTLASL